MSHWWLVFFVCFELDFLLVIVEFAPCRMEFEDREPDQTLLSALERYGSVSFGSNWGAAVHPELVANLGKFRRYDFKSLRDLLRVVRNKRNHFREMPQELQQLLGPLPEGFYRWAWASLGFDKMVCSGFVVTLGVLTGWWRFKGGDSMLMIQGSLEACFLAAL